MDHDIGELRAILERVEPIFRFALKFALHEEAERDPKGDTMLLVAAMSLAAGRALADVAKASIDKGDPHAATKHLMTLVEMGAEDAFKPEDAA